MPSSSGMLARTAVAIEKTGTKRSFDEKPLLEKARDLSVGRFTHPTTRF